MSNFESVRGITLVSHFSYSIHDWMMNRAVWTSFSSCPTACFVIVRLGGSPSLLQALRMNLLNSLYNTMGNITPFIVQTSLILASCE